MPDGVEIGDDTDYEDEGPLVASDPVPGPTFIPGIRSEDVPGDPSLRELQAHARALGLKLVIALVAPDGKAWQKQP